MSNNKQILIVDDDTDFVEMLQNLLVGAGYDVYCAFNGREALTKAEAAQPDLIILDMMMPKVSGINFYHAIYDHEKKCSKYPVFVVTGKHEMEKVFVGLNLEGFFLKPFDSDELLAEIYKVTHEKGYTRESSESRQPKHILIVEDHRDKARELALSFLDAGFTVDLAVSTEQALTKAGEKNPSLVLIHLEFQSGNGERLAFRIKENPAFFNTGVILYCAASGEENVRYDSDRLNELKISRPILTLNPQTLLKASEVWLARSQAA